MLRPNLAFILFYEQSFAVYGLVLNLNFAQSANLSALYNVLIKKFDNLLYTLPDSVQTDLTQHQSHSFLQASTGYPESQEESNSLSQSQYSSTTEETPANAESATENHSLTSDQESLNITEENGS